MDFTALPKASRHLRLASMPFLRRMVDGTPLELRALAAVLLRSARRLLIRSPDQLSRSASRVRRRPLWRPLVSACAATAVLGATASLMRPVFLQDRARVAERVLQHAYVDSLESHAPWLGASVDAALNSEQFRTDREAFALDLIHTGRVSSQRARSLADVAVTEAYKRRIPPALVLGVMLTENDRLRSRARSRVGAVGLMQVNGRSWRHALGRLFGTNLKDDATNLRYGIFILKYVAGLASDSTPDGGWREALLRYNGCIRGTVTRDCHGYPEVVRRNVQAAATATCAGRDFRMCVAGPLALAKRDDTLVYRAAGE